MGKKAVIEILDSVHCKANPEARTIIKPFLEYKGLYYKKQRFGRKLIETTSYLITGREGTSGTFLSGLLPKLKSNNVKIQISGRENTPKLKPDRKIPELNGIVFREDQLNALKKIRLKQRGVILFPTGSGKTIIALGIMSMFTSYRIIFLCHTKALLKQTAEELQKYNFAYHILGDGFKADWKTLHKLDSCILLSTIQSISKVDKKLWIDYFDISIVDEVHHASKEKSQYGNFMLHNLSPMKIGFTGTLPTNEQDKLTMEGFFGPVLRELTDKEGEEIGILAKANINLVCVPYQPTLKAKTYPEMYDLGIVQNEIRNNLIVEESVKSISNNEIVLIIVEKLYHGKVLKKLFKKKNISCPFVQGKTDTDFAEKVKAELKSKKRKIAICTRVWKEGINIPSLNHIILAAGMKDEKAVRQAMGRGRRTAKDKTEIKLTDFMDSCRWLAEHSILRYSIYQKLGWLK